MELLIRWKLHKSLNLSSTVFDWSIRLTDIQSDGRADALAIAIALQRVLHMLSRAKNGLIVKVKVKQMIYIAVLCISRITAEPLYSTPLFIWPYAAANNTALLAWRPSQGTKLYCLVNRGTLGVNNLPRVVARIMPRSDRTRDLSITSPTPYRYTT